MGVCANALIILMFFTATLLSSFAGGRRPQVPCYFIFGDSLLDNGNNNELVTEAKANYPPYGIDFPDGPTGRFSNGRNVADIVAALLGFEQPIPPFATAKVHQILRGVNYASGAAGIRDETSQHMGGRISMNEQLANHGTTVWRLAELIGNGSLVSVQKYLNKCIYTVGIGNNDFINNYFYPKYYDTSKLYTPKEYAELLVQQYSAQLTRLYKYGARKFAISGAGYSGCTPAMMTRYETNECVDAVNGAVIQFNAKLLTTLGDLETKLCDVNFIFIDPPLGYPSSFSITDKSCCNVSTTIGEGQCLSNQVPCNDRKNYVFWDAFHPTESINLVDGARTYEAMAPFYVPESTKRSMQTSEASFVDV